MKKIVFLLAVLFFSLSIYADKIPESEVPANVKSYIQGKYSGSVRVEWEYDKKKDLYKAEFYVDGRKAVLELNNAGKVINSDEVILLKDIPASASSYIKKNFPEAEIFEAKKVVDGQNTSYEIEYALPEKDGYSNSKKIIFDNNGNVTKK